MQDESQKESRNTCRVAIRRCETYESERVEKAMREAVELAGGFNVQGLRVLLKPNILRDSDPGRALTTHPEVLKSAIRLCRSKGAAEILVGDSPGFAPAGFSGRKSGLRQVTEEEGALWLDFHRKKTTRTVPSPLRERAFHFSDVLDSVDAVISLPKLKTHSLLFFTGAMKNLFGLIPGLAKSPFHVRFPGREEFGEMIVDLVQAVKPSYAVFDGIVAMEGPGPGNGYPKSVGLIIAGPSCLAVDIVASKIMGYKTEDIPTNRIGLRRAEELGETIRSDTDIEIVGEKLGDVVVHDFIRISGSEFSSLWNRIMHSRLLQGIEVKLRKKPVFQHEKCIRCGECVNICASGALSMIKGEGKRRIRVKYRRCIRCYCCHEICPADAIVIGKRRR